MTHSQSWQQTEDMMMQKQKSACRDMKSIPLERMECQAILR